jgi:hypothetical protein
MNKTIEEVTMQKSGNNQEDDEEEKMNMEEDEEADRNLCPRSNRSRY